MILYNPLEKTNNETLHKAFLEAFSDYQVKVDLPFWKFQQMLQRRGYHPEISIGAFENERLIGFVLNGFRNWNGMTTVYDLGTGVIEEYRRQGITSDMLLSIKKLLKEKQVEQYLLEVLKPNQSAVQLYKKQGFEVCREFSCFQLDRGNFIPITTCKVESVKSIDIEQFKQFWDFKPSWQNSIASVNAVSEDFNYSVVRYDDKIVGYGVIDKRTGDIPQIAVNRAYRRKGIANSIMTELIKNTESEEIKVLNVDTKFNTMEKFLGKAGFNYGIGQYEMLLKLDKRNDRQS